MDPDRRAEAIALSTINPVLAAGADFGPSNDSYVASTIAIPGAGPNHRRTLSRGTGV